MLKIMKSYVPVFIILALIGASSILTIIDGDMGGLIPFGLVILSLGIITYDIVHLYRKARISND